MKLRYADAVERIPEPSGSVEVVYTSHMLEHLDPNEAKAFLNEAHRVMSRNSWIRVAVPDLRFHVERYIATGDANEFMIRTFLTRVNPRTLRDKVRDLIVGERHHQWMYDGPSLCTLLLAAGFVRPRILDSGVTTIIDPGELDLSERSPESVFVEARKP